MWKPNVHVDRHGSQRTSGIKWRGWRIAAIVLALAFAVRPLPAREGEKDTPQYGAGLILNLPFSENQVTQVVEEVAQNGIIRGTKEYNNDEYITGATSPPSTRVFPDWTENGKVFYKVRSKALNPRNFKDSSDVGMLAVRYVVQGQGEKSTVLRIDALFVEDFRHTVHPSNGTVEGAEYKDIRDRLDAFESMKAETVEAEKETEKEKQSVNQEASAPRAETSSSRSLTAAIAPASPDAPGAGDPSHSPDPPPQTLEQHVQDLRRQVERLVKAPGAPLKSAPFHTASTLQALPTATEVIIVISTAYWLGVETHDGQHGWILRDDLELLP